MDYLDCAYIICEKYTKDLKTLQLAQRQTHDRMLNVSEHGNFVARLHKVNHSHLQEVHTKFKLNIGAWTIGPLFVYLENVLGKRMFK